MLRCMLHSKIHRATVTQSVLEYEGSLTMDVTLMDRAGMRPYEQVVISNLNNGERFETYVIPGPAESGTMCLNGPTARKGLPGDQIIVFCYEYLTEEELGSYQPTIIKVDGKNRISDVVHGDTVVGHTPGRN